MLRQILVESIYWSFSFTESFVHVVQHPEVHPLDIRCTLYDASRINKLSYKKNRKGIQVNPKYCSLMFEAIHNTAAPYEVIWEVHNKGDEAMEDNHLYHQTKRLRVKDATAGRLRNTKESTV